MPALLGTATASYRVGQAAVQKIYLGSSVVFDGTTTGTTTGTTPSAPPPPDFEGIPTPAGLRAPRNFGPYISLTWNLYGHNRLAVTSHIFQRSIDDGVTWTDLTITPTITFVPFTENDNPAQAQPHTARFAYADFPAGVSRLRVAARSGVWQGAWSEPSPYLIKLDPPTTPTGLTASAGGTPPRVTLSWNASTGSVGAPLAYAIEATTSNGAAHAVLAVQSGTSITLGDPNGTGALPEDFVPYNSERIIITPGKAYKFRIYGTYERTPLIKSLDMFPPLSAPTALSAEVTAPNTEPGRCTVWVEGVYSGGAKIRLLANDGGSAITRFDIYLTSTQGNWGSPIAYNSPVREDEGISPVFAYFFSGLTNGTEYYVRAVAVNAQGSGLSAGEGWSEYETVRFRPDANRVAPVSAISATALAPGAKFSYAGNVTYDYPADKRAASLSWTDTPYSSYTPFFEINSLLMSVDGPLGTGKRVAMDWKKVLHAPASRMSNKAGNTVDNLLPNAQYQFRVREVKGIEYGPWRYTGPILTQT